MRILRCQWTTDGTLLKSKNCLRCLSDGHRGEVCFRSRVCGIKGCRSHHRRLLHEDPKKEENSEVAREADASNAVKAVATTGGESSERTLTATIRTTPLPTSEFVALRTVPVYVRDLFFSKLETKIPDFKSLSHDTLISLLMNSSDYLINCQLVSFISQCFELRTKLISMNENCNVL